MVLIKQKIHVGWQNVLNKTVYRAYLVKIYGQCAHCNMYTKMKSKFIQSILLVPLSCPAATWILRAISYDIQMLPVFASWILSLYINVIYRILI